MKICHVCQFGCEDNVELCPICGADLSENTVDNVEEAVEAVEKLISNPVLLASFEDVVSAEIFKDILKDNKIAYTCGEADEEGTMRVVFGGGFVADDIYIDSADFETAEKLYNEFLESEAEFDGDFIFEDEE